jgi:hypothetical protein
MVLFRPLYSGVLIATGAFTGATAIYGGEDRGYTDYPVYDELTLA